MPHIRWPAPSSSGPAPGYDSLIPEGILNVVWVGDSGTAGFGDIVTKGGYVNRVIANAEAEFGTNVFRMRGTNPVRGYIGIHGTEAMGGLELTGAAGGTADCLTNKPISGVGTGQKMFGTFGYHQNTHLVISCAGEPDINNGDSPEAVTARHLDWLTRIRTQLNENNPDCLLMLGCGGYIDWEVYHDHVVACNALIDDMADDFDALFPSQPLIYYRTGHPLHFNWYNALGIWSTTQYHDTVHPNEIGYNRIVDEPVAGVGMYEFMQPTLAALAA